mgnify:CR=1 FL=1|jgi:hypothetical protein
MSESFGSCGSVDHPFKIIKDGDDEVYVLYGAVNDVVPDEVDAYPEDATRFSVTEGDKLHLEVTLNSDGEVTDVEVKKGEVPSNTDTRAGILIGEISTDEDGKINGIGQSLRSSLMLFSCGETHYFSGI